MFADPERLRALEAIVHPLVGGARRQLLAAAPGGAVVVYDVPLLVENDLQPGTTWSWWSTPTTRYAWRACERRRAAAAGRAGPDGRPGEPGDRLAAADHVIDNSGDLAALRAQVQALWAALTRAPT